jgi:hypothetical protein
MDGWNFYANSTGQRFTEDGGYFRSIARILSNELVQILRHITYATISKSNLAPSLHKQWLYIWKRIVEITCFRKTSHSVIKKPSNDC